MMRYFINKLDNSKMKVDSLDTPSILNECLTATYQVGTEMVEIDGTMVEQPKLEFVWQEITKEQYDRLVAGTLKYENGKFIEVIKPQPTKAEIEAQQKADYEREVQSLLLARGYDKDRQIAILCNRGTSEAHDKEFEDMQAVREQCKAEAKAKIYGGKK